MLKGGFEPRPLNHGSENISGPETETSGSRRRQKISGIRQQHRVEHRMIIFYLFYF